MRGSRTATRPAVRARVRRATITAFTVLAATLPTTAAAGSQEIDTALPYVCSLPSGRHSATVRISAVFPGRAAAGEAVRPSDVTTSVELPAQAVADLKELGAAGVRPATRLGIGVAQNGATAEATWRGSAQPVALPPSGPLTLTTTGDVPSVTGRSTGELTFSAGDLVVDLEPAAADGAATGSAALTVDCALADHAADAGRLAAVPVGPEAAGGTDAPGGTPSASPSSGTPEEGDGRPEGRRRDRAPKVAGTAPGAPGAARDVPPCKYDEQYPAGPMSLNAYITGYSNVRKLKGAVLIPPFCTLIEQGEPQFEFYPDFSGATITQHSGGDLHYRGRKQTPPFEATFLTFGFTPTTATLVLEQTGPLTIDSAGSTDFVFTSTDTYVRVPLVLRVVSLKVNGTPLDVGPDCRTEKPLSSPEPDPGKYPGDHLVLHGRGEQNLGEPATGYLLLSGGPLTGEVTIPAFTGCGAGGEDLDRLLTASVSGPGNYVKQIQGQTCFAAAEEVNPDECTPDRQPLKIPVPER